MHPNVLKSVLGWGLLLVVGPLCAQTDVLSVRAHVTTSDATLSRTGRCEIEVEIVPEVDVERALTVRLVLYGGGRRVLARNHRPPVPSREWRRGSAVTYRLTVPFPLEFRVPEGTERLEWYLAFRDTASEKQLMPLGEGRVLYGKVCVGFMKVPVFDRHASAERVGDVIKDALALARKGGESDAWHLLETTFRLVDGDEPKRKLRDALLKIGKFPPPAASAEEEQIVAARIEAERRRYLREVAGRMFDQEKYHGALRILRAIGGKLAEQADHAVIGALADAQRVQKDRQDIKHRLLQSISAEDRDTASKDMEKLGRTTRQLEKARSYLKKKRYALAIRLARGLAFADEKQLRDDAYRVVVTAEKRWLADEPPEQIREAEAAVAHPAWGRTQHILTHKFIIIGPERLIGGIPAPSKLNFDVACVFITDLFGRIPNPAGDRVTVYFKELWDFGGGVGGGKTIDIGRAQPERRGVRLDTGLLYHELTHCVDDTNPIYAGFREGLANVGAAFATASMGQKTDAWHSIDGNLKAFKKDYRDRDLEYWRIQNYGPSAGFFLFFGHKYASSGGAPNWQPYRQFFRAYRRSSGKDVREPLIVRALAYHLMKVFGEGVVDDLIAFRFPLVPSDREALVAEMRAHRDGTLRSGEQASEDFEVFPNSPVPRDLRARDLVLGARGSAPKETQRAALETLGAISQWWVIGPFTCRQADPDAFVFPPEYEIELEKEYRSRAHVPRWRRPGQKRPVTQRPTGWIHFSYNYQANSAFYGLTHVTVLKDAAVWFHARADDDLTLFVNDRLVGKYRRRGGRGGVAWRGPSPPLPDRIRFEGTLRSGRNKILFKTKNRHGPSGFALAISDRQGEPVPGLVDDALPAVPRQPAEAAPWRKVLKESFDSRSGLSRLDQAVGRFSVRRKALVGERTDRRVPWRKYTVRPGFPKDSPSNLAWLKRKYTKSLGEFQLSLGLEAPGGCPKLGICFQGDGGKDGLGGWTFILHPQGPRSVMARLERYDRLVYQTQPVEPQGQGRQRLRLEYRDQRVSAWLGDQVLFEQVSIRPIPARSRIGLLTWGPDLRIRTLELRKGRK